MVGDIMQPTHLLFVLVVALLVLGPKRLPEVGRTLGSGIRDFRQALSGEAPERAHPDDPGQVPSAATDRAHEPGTDDGVAWPEGAVGPPFYDEAVDAATPEPVTPAAEGHHPDAGSHAGDATAVGTHAAPDASTELHVETPEAVATHLDTASTGVTPDAADTVVSHTEGPGSAPEPPSAPPAGSGD